MTTSTRARPSHRRARDADREPADDQRVRSPHDARARARGDHDVVPRPPPRRAQGHLRLPPPGGPEGHAGRDPEAGMSTDRWRGGSPAAPPGRGDPDLRQPFIARMDEVEPAQLAEAPWMEGVLSLNMVGFMAVPLVAQDRPVGLVTAFADHARAPSRTRSLSWPPRWEQRRHRPRQRARLALARAAQPLPRGGGRGAHQGAPGDAHRARRSRSSWRTATSPSRPRTRSCAAGAPQGRPPQPHRPRAQHPGHRHPDRGTHPRPLRRGSAEKAGKFVEIITQESTRLADLIASALQAAVLGVPRAGPLPPR